MVPNLFCLKGHLFFMKGIEGHQVNFFYIPHPSSPSFLLSSFPARPTASILGQKVIVFYMFREILQHSKQLEIFRFLPRISYFHRNGHSGSYPTGLSCWNGDFAVVAHIFLKFFRRSRATFWGLAGHFWPAGHRLGTTGITDPGWI